MRSSDETAIPFTHISKRDLAQIPHVDMGDNVIGLKVDNLSAQHRGKLHSALSLHGFYAPQMKTEHGHILSIDLKLANHQQSLALLKSAPDDHCGGITGYNFGPEPSYKPLNTEPVKAVYRQLRENPSSPLPEENADMLMNWIAQRTMHALQDGEPKTSPLDFSGTCGWGQGHIGHQCEQMGIKVSYHQIANLSNSSTNRHAFNIVTIPFTDQEGLTKDKHYLVDTTFRQFFDSEFNGIGRNDVIRSWGASLVKSEEGRKLADSLLKHGHAELTDETARLYVEGQTAKRNPSTGFYDPVAWEERSPVERLLKSTTRNDYDLDEMKGKNTEPPCDISSQAIPERPLFKRLFSRPAP